MDRPNPHLWYPPSVANYADEDELAEIVAVNERHLDHEAARLLDDVANHHGRDWSNPAIATSLRRILRLVARHLRGEP